MKTPMQELIDTLNNLNPNNGDTRLLKTAILSQATELLEKEKKCIIDAHDVRFIMKSLKENKDGIKAVYRSGEQYYNETFK